MDGVYSELEEYAQQVQILRIVHGLDFNVRGVLILRDSLPLSCVCVCVCVCVSP